MHVPQFPPDEPDDADDPDDELLGELLDPLDDDPDELLPDDPLDTLELEPLDRWHVPNRAANGNRPGDESNPVQTQGDVQSPSSTQRLPFQIITHSPEHVRLLDGWLEADCDDTDELERLLDDDDDPDDELRELELPLERLDDDPLLWLDDDEAWHDPNRASPSNSPGDVSKPPQTHGELQSSLTQAPLVQ